MHPLLRNLLTAGCGCVAILVSARIVNAQEASRFEDLRVLLNPGGHIAVSDRYGVPIEGRFVALSPHALRVALRSGEVVDVPEASVAKVERLSSRARRGAVNGLMAGAIVGALAVALTPPCRGFCPAPGRGAVILPIAGIFGGVAAGIGAGVGSAMTERRVIYLAPRREPKTLPD